MVPTWNVHLPMHDRVYRLTGRDAIDLLHRISTNDLSPVNAGGGATTILTTEKGRVVHVISVHAEPNGSLLVAAPFDPEGTTATWIARFVIMEDVVVEEVTDEFRTVVSFLWDPAHDRWQEPPTPERIRTIPVRCWTNRWSTLIVPRVDSAPIPTVLLDAGARLVDAGEFREKRVRAGVPWEGMELTDERHPLEARLRALISFTKGCYVGQEVVARLDSYRKVQQVLSRFTGTLPEDLPLPMTLMSREGQEAGMITSACNGRGAGAHALGFLRVADILPDAVFSTPQGGTLRLVDDSIEDGVYRLFP